MIRPSAGSGRAGQAKHLPGLSARQAMDSQAATYLVKMELTPQVLRDTLELVKKRLLDEEKTVVA